MQKTGPQRVPPCRSLHLQLKIGISTRNKKTTFLALAVFFPSSLVFLIVVEWFLIVILTKAYQKTEVLNQNPMKIPSEPIRK